jgi:hypothetical protein
MRAFPCLPPLLLLLTLSAPLLGSDTPGPSPLPADLESRLALSALPPHLRDAATVYTLDPAVGFRIARPGTNGFHAFVARNDPGIYQGAWAHDAYDDLLIPVAYDAAGVDSYMRPYFDLASLRAEGVAAAAAKRTLEERYLRGEYAAPIRPGIAYMLAPIVRGYRRPEDSADIVTFSLPHYMIYAPGVDNADIGAGPTLRHPFILSRQPGPHGLMILLAGNEERKAIREENSGLLTELCELDPLLCLPGGGS